MALAPRGNHIVMLMVAAIKGAPADPPSDDTLTALLLEELARY